VRERRKGEDDGEDKAEKNECGTENAGEEHAGPIAVADCVNDEVWVVLLSKRSLDVHRDGPEGRGVGGLLKSEEHDKAFLRGEV